jgi:hypothetical protein
MIVGRGSKVEISTCHRQRARPSVYPQPDTLLFQRYDWPLSDSAAGFRHRGRSRSFFLCLFSQLGQAMLAAIRRASGGVFGGKEPF